MAISAGKIIMISCFKPEDTYSIHIPLGSCVWVMRVSHVIIQPDNMFLVSGPLLYNATHDIRAPFVVSASSYTILVQDAHIMGVYDDVATMVAHF